MRLIKRETRRRAVLSVVFGLLLLVGICCAFFLSAVTMRKLYEKKLEIAEIRILTLEKEKKAVTHKVYKALEEIKAGEQINEENVIETETVSGMEKGLYMTAEGLGSTSRIDIAQGTFITETMLYFTEEKEILNEVGYRDIKIQGNISAGDYVDIRICYPNGEDFKVLSAKRVEGLENTTVIYMRLTEQEMLMMSSAVTDISYMDAELYTVKCCYFAEEENKVNYLPSEQVLELITEYEEDNFVQKKLVCIEKRRALERRVLGGE